jgi:hypothetical protein
VKRSIALVLSLTAIACAAKPGPPKVSLGPLTANSGSPSKPGLTQVGAHRKIDPKLLRKGKWDKNGWKLMLQSPGAQGLRVHVTGMDLAGAKLIVRGADGETQSFQAKGPNGDGEFWTGLVTGDSVTLELQGARKGPLPFQIPELSHLWKLP